MLVILTVIALLCVAWWCAPYLLVVGVSAIGVGGWLVGMILMITGNVELALIVLIVTYFFWKTHIVPLYKTTEHYKHTKRLESEKQAIAETSRKAYRDAERRKRQEAIKLKKLECQAAKQLDVNPEPRQNPKPALRSKLREQRANQ